MNIWEASVSCGVRQLDELRMEDFRDLVAQNIVSYGDEDYFKKGYWYIFSDNQMGAGRAIARTIKAKKLGKLVSTGWATNPNSGNKIQTWMWRYNGKQPTEWVRDVRRNEDYGDDDY